MSAYARACVCGCMLQTTTQYYRYVLDMYIRYIFIYIYTCMQTYENPMQQTTPQYNRYALEYWCIYGVYIYIYVCVYIYIYIYTCIYIHIYMYNGISWWIFRSIWCIYTYICMYIHIHTYVYALLTANISTATLPHTGIYINVYTIYMYKYM